MLRRDCSPLVALAVAACGPVFTVATSDGGPLAEASFDASASGEDAGQDATRRHDATTDDASVRDGSVKDDGSDEDSSPIELDGGVPTDAVACGRTCPTGFDCVATECVDRASARFSATTNRPFNWSYGYAQSLGATFHLYVSPWSPGLSIDVWTDTNTHTLEPSVFYNGGHTTQTYGGMTILGGALGLYPGPTGQTSIVRWTAPASGLFAINATFTGLSTPATRIEVGILINNATGKGQSGALNAYGGGNTFTPASISGQMLSAGAFVDFYATIITNMDDPPGGTSVDARITAE